ncbi:hypothetical protein BZA77DRAFT_121599 [Pyronema omphalodes]|nr:hypothetical protein BZA77DRAFT_121599 [Pyronema omphalodes]
MSASAERLQLLHDHIRLSLLERKRAIKSGHPPNPRTINEISRSLDTLQQGIESLERDYRQQEAAGNVPPETTTEHNETLSKLHLDFSDLQSEFSSSNSTALSSEDLLLDLHAIPHSSSGPTQTQTRSSLESAAREALTGSRASPEAIRKVSKTVRFLEEDQAQETENNSTMSSQSLLQLHDRVMNEQDLSLDRLSASIRNQRELSIAIGDELEDHVRLLGDVEEQVDRHQGRLDSARRRLDGVARTAREHGSLVIIIVLIIILVLLIAVLK